VSSDPDWQQTTVIGVVRDARVFDVRGGNQSIVYTPALQAGRLAHFKYLVVRTPPSSSREVQRALESLGVEVLPTLQSLSYVRGRTLLQERMLGALGGYFGLLGLLVVTVGLYGLMSYILSLRRREFGLYMAVGATSVQVARLVFKDAFAIAVMGMLAGLAVVLGSTRLLSSVLIDTNPADPVAITLASLAILMATSAAGAIPALRASRVDPAAELRSE
jgi:ABC-type antimicrobial peptide transport system permease subunit